MPDVPLFYFIGAYCYHGCLEMVNVTDRTYTVPRYFSELYCTSHIIVLCIIAATFFPAQTAVYAGLGMSKQAKPEHPDCREKIRMGCNSPRGKWQSAQSGNEKQGDNRHRRINRRSNYKKLRFIGWQMTDRLMCCQE